MIHLPAIVRGRPFLAVFAACVSIVTCPVAHATLQFSDGFAYNTGPLAGDTPPLGAASAWTTSSGDTQVTAGSVTYPGMTSTGNKATVTGAVDANGDISSVSLSFNSAAGSGIEWTSFTMDLASGSASSGFDVLAFNGSGGSGPSLGLIFNSGLYGIDNNTSPDTLSTSTTPVTGAANLLVGEFDFTAGEIYLFVNPSLNSTPSTASASASLAMSAGFKASGFDGLVLAAGYTPTATTAFNMDSIMIGTTFADVVPEPSVWVAILGSLGLLGIVMRNRRACRA